MVAEQANEQASNEMWWVHRGWVGGYMGDTKMAAQDKDNLFVCLNQRNRLGYKTKCLLEMWVVQRWRPKIRVVCMFRKGMDLFFGYPLGTERVQNKECGCSAKQAFYQCG